MKGKQALRRNVDKEEYPKIFGMLREGKEMKIYRRRPMNSAKILKTAISGGGPESARMAREVYE